MIPFSEPDMRGRGFLGFLPIPTLDFRQVPDVPGVYAVLGVGSPLFMDGSPAGAFRGDPSVAKAVLEHRWRPGAETLYIGKAATAKSHLRKRTSDYVKHGSGANARHWGGRYLWQVIGLDLRLAWLICDDARECERRLILDFEAAFQGLPFANLVH